MHLRDILVVLDNAPGNPDRLAIALDLARQHNAHLTGLCPLDLLLPPDLGLLLGGYPDALALQYATEQMDAQTQEKAAPIESHFREQLRLSSVQGEYQALSGTVSSVVAARVRTADLAIIGQPDPDADLPATGRYLLEDVLLAAGRPVLAIPFAGKFETIGKTVLVAWMNSREAARAMNDALPLIDPGANVTVLSVQRVRAAEDDELPSADAAEHLARHGLRATAARTVNDGSLSDSEAILSYAADIGADLLVAGCYGHSRARELVLGGVSRGLLRQMTVPLLMSH